MLKIFNISTLLLFVCFLIAPTISYAFNKEVDTQTLNLSEEEETHSNNKSKTKNNNITEEEENEIQYHFSCNIKYSSSKKNLAKRKLNSLKHTIKDDLVFKIPLPPPEQFL